MRRTNQTLHSRKPFVFKSFCSQFSLTAFCDGIYFWVANLDFIISSLMTQTHLGERWTLKTTGNVSGWLTLKQSSLLAALENEDDA